MTGRIGNYEYSLCPSHVGLNRWQVKRGNFIMAVFGSRDQAEGYAQGKHDAERAAQ